MSGREGAGIRPEGQIFEFDVSLWEGISNPDGKEDIRNVKTGHSVRDAGVRW